MSNEIQTTPRRVGIVGAGQLALMMAEEAHDVNVRTIVLAATPDDAAIEKSDEVLMGDAKDISALRALASTSDVVTFDHELVDLDHISLLEQEGFVVRPGSDALRYAVDKAHQRRRFFDAGLPVPRFVVVTNSKDERLTRFLDELRDEPVLKAARGGYDGRGVVFPSSREATLSIIDEWGQRGEVLVEERLELEGEVAQLVVRAHDGALALYPLVTTVQNDGMCVEVRFPADVEPDVEAQSDALSRSVAALVKGVGVLAIEYFVTSKGLFINEIALRPHNSGHWTIEGATTSQFANHLLAVSAQDLGATSAKVPHAVMVNVVGASVPGSLDAARALPDIYVHDYAKTWRPGRKLGHVTAVGDDRDLVHVRAWQGARAYGTSMKEVS